MFTTYFSLPEMLSQNVSNTPNTPTDVMHFISTKKRRKKDEIPSPFSHGATVSYTVSLNCKLTEWETDYILFDTDPLPNKHSKNLKKNKGIKLERCGPVKRIFLSNK
jgi:hypothetical protein